MEDDAEPDSTDEGGYEDEIRYKGYEECKLTKCPSKTKVCRRFICELYDKGCETECNNTDPSKPLYMCGICDRDTKECSLESRKYIHKEFKRGKKGGIVPFNFQAGVEDELRFLTWKRNEVRQTLNMTKNKNKRKPLEEEIELLEHSMGHFEKVLEIKDPEIWTVTDLVHEQGDSDDEDRGFGLARDPLQFGKDVLGWIGQHGFLVAVLIGGVAYIALLL